MSSDSQYAPAVSTSSFDMSGRRVMVTGASRGIGRAVVATLSAAGADVAFTHADDAEGAGQTVALARSDRLCVGFSIPNGTPDAPDRVVSEATQAIGGIDVLVLNAWVDVRQPVFELDMPTVERQVRANFLDNLELATRCARKMRESGWGRLLFIGSINQVTPLPVLPVYAALKCAMSSIMRSLAVELAEHGVTANSLLPGL